MTKHCQVCGRVSDWSALLLIGYQTDGLDGYVELRNCLCGATYGREVSSPASSIAPDPRKVAGLEA